MSTPAASAGSRWILHPIADVLAAGSGAAFALFAMFLLAGARQETGLSFAALALVSIVFSLPHFAASYERLYSSRATLMAHPWVAVGAPIALAAVAVATLYHPATVGVWFVKVMVAWSGYHYTGQTFGIALIYFRKHGFALAGWERRLLMVPLTLSYVVPIARFELSERTQPYHAVTQTTLASMAQGAFGVGPPAGLEPWLLGALAASVAVLVGWGLHRYVRGGFSLPWMGFLVLAAQLLWFVPGAENPLFNVYVPAFHAMQYLVVVLAFHRAAWTGRGVSPWRTPVLYYTAMIALGAFLFEGVPGMLARLGHEKEVAYAAVLAFVNLHHFMIDGVIWKLRRPELREALVEAAPAPEPAARAA